jgi:hypothetical protein
MPLKAEGISPMGAALEALSIQAEIQARDFNRRNTQAFATAASMLNNFSMRAGAELVPAPIDLRQNNNILTSDQFNFNGFVNGVIDGATTV